MCGKAWWTGLGQHARNKPRDKLVIMILRDTEEFHYFFININNSQISFKLTSFIRNIFQVFMSDELEMSNFFCLLTELVMNSIMNEWIEWIRSIFKNLKRMNTFPIQNNALVNLLFDEWYDYSNNINLCLNNKSNTLCWCSIYSW